MIYYYLEEQQLKT